jgi:DHA1 family tetracycline resistance protein-like MFS transporter
VFRGGIRFYLCPITTPRKPALAFIFVTLVLDIIGIGVVIPILPKLVENFQGNVASAAHTYGLLASLYSLMQFICAPILGSLSDRYGRRPVILGSLFGSGLDYLLLAFAPNLGWFFVGRIIAGITGANFAAATAYIADISPPEKRAANFGLIGAAFGLGFILGPALGGWLGGFGLQVPFFVAGGLTLINWLYGWFVLPESLAPENRRAFSWKRSNPVGALLHLRNHPMAFGLAGTFFLMNLAHQVLPATWVLYTSYRYNWTTGQTGASLAIVGLMAAIVQGGLTRKVVAAIGEKKTALMGMSVAAVAYAAYGFASEGWMIYWILVVGSIGGVTSPAVQGLISRDVGADEQGGVQGSLMSLSSVAGILGPMVATGLFGFFISDRTPVKVPGAHCFFSAVLVVVALFLALRLFQKHAAADAAAAQAAGAK